MTTHSSSGEYVLGHSGTELGRLMTRAETLGPLTERVLRGAGIEEGMRVLDVGSGAGDVSFLIAQLVGGSGSVLGIDRAAAATEMARQRAQQLGISNASFVCSAIDALNEPASFDAVVGRLFLSHQPDPVVVVRQAAAQVRQNGLIIFHELDLSLRCMGSWPVVPFYEQCRAWTIEAQKRCGIDIEIGKKLYRIFKAAGLPGPGMRMERPFGPYSHTAMAELLAELVRSLLPKIVEFGIASASEIQIDTLANRIESELAAADAIMIGTPLVGAWSRKP